MQLNFSALSGSMRKVVGQEGTGGTSRLHAPSARPTLPGVTGDIRGQLPASKIETQADHPEMSPLSHHELEEVGHRKPRIDALVPLVPPVPPDNDAIRARGEDGDELQAQADPFIERRDQLGRAGLHQDDAALMAWKLERRDREHDERRLCIECQHLFGDADGWRCFRWRQRQVFSPAIPSDMVTSILHRCGGFEVVLPQSG
jgi:hypothetical protein